MFGQLPEGLIGTDPKYPPIVDHSWLSPENYDNYPSDNNPVRVVPKLSEVWNHDPSKNIAIIQNATVQPLGLKTSEQQIDDVKNKTQEVIREAKKAMMAGLVGSEISGHLRSRFVQRDIEAASDQLKELSQEVGLLGNVYVDASAFTSLNDAESFLNQHKNRLASNLLFDAEKVNSAMVSVIASKFRKNVVSQINYDQVTLNKYKNHLVSSGRIPGDFAINTKEDLRRAFLYQKPKYEMEFVPKITKKLSSEDINRGIVENLAEKSERRKESEDALLFRVIEPIISYSQECLSKGKDRNDLKEVLRSKYSSLDLNQAAPYVGIVISEAGLTAGHVDELIKEGKISSFIGDELKKIANKFLVKKSSFSENRKKSEYSGVSGYFYNSSRPEKTEETDPYRKASLQALRKGISIDQVRDKLLTKFSEDEANKILSDAMSSLNSSPAGIVANKFEPRKKEALVEDLKPKKTLPDKSSIISGIQEILGYYEGCTGDIQIEDSPQNFQSLEIGELANEAGIDGTIG